MQTRSFDERDTATIIDLFTRVFAQSDGAAEGEMVGRLAAEMIATTDTHDLHGFVATEENRIVGAVLFSRLRFDTAIEAFILSPMAIDTACQRRGVGSTLIRHGLDRLRRQGVELVVTYGDPAYYTRLGFEALSTQTLPAPFALSQPIGWLGQALDGGAIAPVAGRCRCVAALDNPDYW